MQEHLFNDGANIEQNFETTNNLHENQQNGGESLSIANHEITFLHIICRFYCLFAPFSPKM